MFYLVIWPPTISLTQNNAKILEEALEVNKNVLQVALFSPTSKGLLHEEKYSICAL